MTRFQIVLRFLGGSFGNIRIDRTIIVYAANAGDAFEQAERYITERSNDPALRINVKPLTA